MTDPDDEELDGMMGIRTMWRELPDEEPPGRGLDALMAAARTKAAEMAPLPQKESWWRRTLAMLTQPPMLAAATVIVLVGSTVVLTRRGGMESATTERTVSRDRDPVPVRNPGSIAGAVDKEKAVANTEGSVERRTGQTKKDSNEKGEGRLGPGGVSGGALDRGATPRPRPPTMTPPELPEPIPIKVERPTEEDPRIVTEGGQGLGVDRPQGQDTQVREATKPTTTVDTVVTRPTAPPTAGGPDTVRQLVKRAETAAGRKDCATVKATVERIRKLDENAYKTRVVTQAAIKSCL